MINKMDMGKKSGQTVLNLLANMLKVKNKVKEKKIQFFLGRWHSKYEGDFYSNSIHGNGIY